MMFFTSFKMMLLVSLSTMRCLHQNIRRSRHHVRRKHRNVLCPFLRKKSPSLSTRTLGSPNNFEPSIYIQLFSFSYVNTGRIRNGVRYIHFNKFFYIKSDFIQFINILVFIFCPRGKKRNKYLHYTAIISISNLT